MAGINETREVLKVINRNIQQRRATASKAQTVRLPSLPSAPSSSFTSPTHIPHAGPRPPSSQAPTRHPQPHVPIHGRPRTCIPTPHLHTLMGLLSPELVDAFPGGRARPCVTSSAQGSTAGTSRSGRSASASACCVPSERRRYAGESRGCGRTRGARIPVDSSPGEEADESPETFGTRACASLPCARSVRSSLCRPSWDACRCCSLTRGRAGWEVGMVRTRRYLSDYVGVGSERRWWWLSPGRRRLEGMGREAGRGVGWDDAGCGSLLAVKGAGSACLASWRGALLVMLSLSRRLVIPIY